MRNETKNFFLKAVYYGIGIHTFALFVAFPTSTLAFLLCPLFHNDNIVCGVPYKYAGIFIMPTVSQEFIPFCTVSTKN